MNMRWIVGIFFVGCITVQQVWAETLLGLPVEGVQTIVLRNEVGKNQIRFVSSATAGGDPRYSVGDFGRVEAGSDKFGGFDRED